MSSGFSGVRRPVARLLIAAVLAGFLCQAGGTQAAVDVNTFEYVGFRLGDYPRAGMGRPPVDPLFDREAMHPGVEVYALAGKELPQPGWLPAAAMELYYNLDGLYRIVVELAPSAEVAAVAEQIQDQYGVTLREWEGGLVHSEDVLRMEVATRLRSGQTQVIFTQTDGQRKIERDLRVLRSVVRERRIEALRQKLDATPVEEDADAPLKRD